MGTNTDIGGDDGLISSSNRLGRGVYAPHPAGTPKYSGSNDTASISKQARLQVELADRQTWRQFRDSLPERARKLADVLSPQSTRGGVGFVDFLVQSVSSEFREKVQVSEVVGDSYIAYFFGQSAPTITVSGGLCNTEQDQWYDSFHVLYQDIIRGTKLAQRQVPVTFLYDNRVVRGSITSLSTNLRAETETYASFTFQMLVKSLDIVDPDEIHVTDLSQVSGLGLDISDDLQRAVTTIHTSIEAAQAASSTSALDSALSAVRDGADRAAIQARLEQNQTASQQPVSSSNTGLQVGGSEQATPLPFDRLFPPLFQ